jgi:hypothetical protein
MMTALLTTTSIWPKALRVFSKSCLTFSGLGSGKGDGSNRHTGVMGFVRMKGVRQWGTVAHQAASRARAYFVYCCVTVPSG